MPFFRQATFWSVLLGYGLLSACTARFSGVHSDFPIYWPANTWLLVCLVCGTRQQWRDLCLAAAVGALAGAMLAGPRWLQTVSQFPPDLGIILLVALLLQRTALAQQFEQSAANMLRLFVIGAVLPAVATSLVDSAILMGFGAGSYLGLLAPRMSGEILGASGFLPLALWIARQGWTTLRHGLRQPGSLLGLLLVLGLNAAALHFISRPFVMLTASLAIGALCMPLEGILLTVWLQLVLFAVGRAYGLFYAPMLESQWEILALVIPVILPAHLLAATQVNSRSSQQRLREALTRMEAVFASMHEGIVIRDGEGHVVLANQQASNILQLPPELLQGKTLLEPSWQTIHADGSPFPGDTHPAMQVLRDGQPQVGVVMGMRTPQGEQRWISVNSRPFRNESSSWRVISTFVDITEQRQATSALTAVEARFRGLLDNAPDAIITVDSQQCIVGVNKAAGQLFDYPDGSLLGQPLVLLLPEGARAQHELQVAAFANEANAGRRMGAGRAVSGRRRNGDCFPMEIALAKVELPDGQFYMAIGRDISSRVANENSLYQLSQAMAQSPTGFVITDLKARIEYINYAFEALTGFTHAQLLGRDFTQLRSPNTPAERFRLMWEHLSQGKSWRGPLVNCRPDGQEYDVFAMIAPIRDAAGRVTKYLGVMEDITERKRIGRELDRHREHLEEMVAERTQELMAAKTVAEKATQAKSAFLANMSHEIRTPLNAVLGFAHLLHEELRDPQQLDYLSKIDMAAQHLLGVIDDILDFSRVEAGKLEIKHDSFAVQDLLEYVQNLTCSRVGNKPVTVSVAIDANTPLLIESDWLRLTQILGNFASNAAKFTEAGSIVLRARQCNTEGRAPSLRFEVQDTGIGLTTEQRDQLFTPFTQADPSITRRYGGTGLGLALSRNLAAALDGVVGVDSEAGVGSCFWLSIPLRRATAVTMAARPLQRAASIKLQGKVLMVEDNPLNQALLQATLAHAGLCYEIAGNGRQALEWCARQAFDAILMDMQMPEMDGLTATRRLRQEAATATTPIIAMTANVFAEDHAACLEAGMNEFLTKPLQAEQLLQVLARYLPVAEASVQPALEASIAAQLGPLARGLQASGEVDLAIAWNMVAGSAELLEQVLRVFIEHHLGMPEQIDACLAAGDKTTAARQLHTLKGAAASIGAANLADAVSTMERQLDDAARIAENIGVLQRAMKKIAMGLGQG